MKTNDAVEAFKQKIGDSAYRKLLLRLQTVNTHIAQYGIRWYNDRTLMLTGYAYGEFYDWDLYFENIYMSYYGISCFCRNNVESFLNEQLECGYVPRFLMNRQKWQRNFFRQHFKPFLAQAVLMGCRQSGRYEWLEGKYYQRLCKYLDHWVWYWDFDKNGLCVWDSSDHSGMDNQFSRAGAISSMAIEGVDLNCYLVREFEAIAEIAEQLGFSADASAFGVKAAQIAAKIDAVLWNEKDHFYYDRNERTGQVVPVKSISGFTPMWVGFSPALRVEQMVKEHLLNPDEFWRPWPVATYAKTEPDYSPQRVGTECTFRGAVWIPTNYMIFHGLLKYGFTKEAEQLAYRTFEMVLREEQTREFYNAENGCGQGLNPFWGWTTLAYLMPLEFELGYDPSDVVHTDFKPIASELLGLEFPPYVGYRAPQ